MLNPAAAAVMAKMQAASWCVTVDGKATYKPTEADAAEFRARVLRVYARDGKSVPAITISAPRG